MGGGGSADGGRGAGWRASGVSHHARDASQPSPGGGGSASRHSASSGGHRRRTCIWASCPRQGRTRRSQGAPGCARHSSRLMAWLTSTRSTPGASAASRMSVAWPGCQCLGEMPVSSSSTTDATRTSSRAAIGVCSLGNRSSQMSASSPVWWLAWPYGIGPPRGCAKSPIQSVGKPLPRAAPARSLTKASKVGCPQLRLRDSRTACQPGPSGGKACAPAMQPSAVAPTTRGGPGAGLATAAHRFAASPGVPPLAEGAASAWAAEAGASAEPPPSGCPLASGGAQPAARRTARRTAGRIRNAARTRLRRRPVAAGLLGWPGTPPGGHPC